jgi:SPP1 gp7 family putative phage head morphogenesis protein
MEKRNNYWADRAALSQTKLTNQSIKQTEKQLKKYYQKSMEKIIGQFELTYNKVISNIEEGKDPTPADLYKLDSYWKMQGQLKEELQKLGDNQVLLLSQQFTEQYIGVYESLAIPSQAAYSTIDTATANQMINTIWCADGQSWSNRVWKNTDLLQQTLNDSLIDCVVTGSKSGKLKHQLIDLLQDRLKEDFHKAYSRADSIVRTEMAHIQTQAAQHRYKDYGIKEVQVWADKDERRCDVCGKLHKKRYPIGSAMPIPAHPRCRCCIIPIVE